MSGSELVSLEDAKGSGEFADGLVAEKRPKPDALSEHDPRLLELAVEDSAKLEDGLLSEKRGVEDRGVRALGPTAHPYFEEPCDSSALLLPTPELPPEISLNQPGRGAVSCCASALSSIMLGSNAFESELTVASARPISPAVVTFSAGRALGPASSRALLRLDVDTSQPLNGSVTSPLDAGPSRLAPAVLNRLPSDRPLAVAPSACATVATETDQSGPGKSARAVA